MKKSKIYKTKKWGEWIDQVKKSGNLFLHGILGSELVDQKGDNEILWVDKGIIKLISNDIKKIESDGIDVNKEIIDKKGRFIYSSRTVYPPLMKEEKMTYFKLKKEIKPGVFCFDWREHIPITVKYLDEFFNILFSEDKNLKINIITHSMGGCILLSFLADCEKYDENINKIIFCAPPFYGSLRPLKVIEDGEGLDGGLEIINSYFLRNTAVTLPGLNDLLIAPEGIFPDQVDFGSNYKVKNLIYPIKDLDIYKAKNYLNKHNKTLQQKLLDNSKKYYEQKEIKNEKFIKRFKDKTSIIIGLNGKTPFSAQKETTDDDAYYKYWVFGYNLEASDKTKITNGDGTVLFQSSYLKDLPKDSYFAYIPAVDKFNRVNRDSHGEIVDRPEVIAGIKNIMEDKKPTDLVSCDKFFPKIDWKNETTKKINLYKYLTYEEREKIRQYTAKVYWASRELDPENDAEIFRETRGAAINVIKKGKNIKKEAKKINQSEEFLENHVKKLLFPLL